MGHGTTHQINTTYSELDRHFKSLGHSNVFIGTVEADPTIHDLVKEVTEFHPTAIMIWQEIPRIHGSDSSTLPALKSVPL